jgi:hypothetical protein
MQLDPEGQAGGLPKPDFPTLTRRVRTLAHELSEVERLMAESETGLKATRRKAESDFRDEQARADTRLRQDFETARLATEELKARLAARRASRPARLDAATAGARGRLGADLREEQRRRDAELETAAKRLEAEVATETTPIEQRLRRWEKGQAETGKLRGQAVKAVREFAVLHGWAPADSGEWSGVIDVDADPDLMAGEVQETFTDVLDRVARASRWWGADFARVGRVVFLQALLVLLGAGAVFVAIRLGNRPMDAAPVLAAALGLTAILQLTAWLIRRRYHRTARDLYERTVGQASRFTRHAEAALKHHDMRLIACGETHHRKLEQARQEVQEAFLERTAGTRRRFEWLEKRREGAEARAAARHERKLRQRETEEARRLRELDAVRKEERERDLAAHRKHLLALETAHAGLSANVAERRASAIADFTAFAKAAGEAADRWPPPWEAIEPRRFELRRSFPEAVKIGRLDLALAAVRDVPEGTPVPSPEEAPGSSPEFALPITISFPDHGSLLVRYGATDRDRALEVLSGAVLKALAAFPPGKVRLTILDPVGLGQSFSALMHLADHDEDLVHGRIWTETAHIERRLAELTEHIEKVIQKYLRNKYATITEYNAEAGDLQEPYHFLVVADFPSGFNDIATERLASILQSGPRCGVYTLIAQDTRQEVLPQLDAALLRRNGPALAFHREVLVVDDEHLSRGRYRAEPLPTPEFVIALLDRVGRLSVEASRVELPFSAVVPSEDELWSGSAQTGVRVSIGRTGAERLQYFDLGRGTAQHALVAGRTGSGKSTLFHVMITNMALWFSPDELQFYLIDFKKGVEFKVYATHGLPHARVVAIESDREFGLSVLRAVDTELARRGDLFRGRGVQDLATWRRQGGGETLPRTILLIDEFQEFFTDDDAVAHDAAVLLDRFVRQGRAFGIHVVLGSQTLSGIYTLARGTLGQMGVRIALQCNEADSYLILSEDNGVARLLGRPGEAIYNDKSGLVEGNNPFQVVWLTDDEQRRRLRRISERAAASDLPHRATVVFEGNQPADVLGNRDLLALTSGAAPAGDGTDRVWLGEPNAIKGPTEVSFLPVSGGNLLVVGQRRDAAFAMMAASVLALAARHRGDGARIVILDGGGHEPEFAQRFEDLFVALPGRLERHDIRTTPEAVAEIAGIVKAREDASDDQPPVFLFAFGIQRLRMLRREEEYSIKFGEEESASAGEHFGTILAEGPPRRVHTIVWCDTVQNLQRTLSRRAMREFDMRVLFQMSAADSSELIESSAANRLGLASALLAVESLGTFEKFRPYAVPSHDMMRRLAPPADSLAPSGIEAPPVTPPSRRSEDR